MIKVFLVEDEFSIRESIKKTVEWEKEGFAFVGEAGDGEMAYPLIQEKQPDIVITDIRMPFMDGLELSRLIREKLPNVKILILSGYDEFDYAQEAINIGVAEYLLKPVAGAKLLESLKRIGGEIEDERRQIDLKEMYQRELEEGKKLEVQKFFRNVIDGKLSMREVLEQGQHLGIDMTAPWYNVNLLEIQPDETGEEKAERLLAEREEILDKIMGVLEEVDQVRMYEQVGEILCMINMAQTKEQLIGQRERGISKLQEIMADYPEMKYFLAIGTPVERLREIRQSYHSANRVFAERYLCQKSKIFDAEQAEQTKVSIPSYQGEEINLKALDLSGLDHRIIYNFLRSGSAEEVEDFVTNYFQSLGQENMESLMLRQYVVMDNLFCIISFLKNMSVEEHKINETFGNFKDTSGQIVTLQSTIVYMQDILKKAIVFRNQASEKKYSSMISEAKKYIHDHYAQEDISLHTVASSVNVSPNHFSAIFSQETGQTFIEYLTQVRMEKAKELLLCSSMKSSEIGFEVGYKDPHYFSYIFKKTQNMTAKEFRNAKQ